MSIKSLFLRRGYSLIEAVIGLSILAILLFAVGDAVTMTLRSVALSGGRASTARTVSELTSRMSEEARSSSAVFIPASDIFGNSDSGTSAHEVDFFRRLSAGGDSYVAYYFDASAGTVTRYEYSLVAGAVAIEHADLAASNIAMFSPERSSASSMSDIVDAGSVSDVSILYGVSGVVGGNDVVSLLLQGAASGGVTPPTMEVHLASRAAPTALALLAPARTPPTPAPIQVIPFVIWHAKVKPPRGVWHFASPGDPGPVDGSGAHSVMLPGTVQFFGPGSGFSWFDFLSANPIVESGTYSFTDANGNLITVAISCGDVACPKFRPMPTSGSPPPPIGGVGFDAAP